MDRLMSGARPTGSLHLGQYLAAFKPFVDSECEGDSYFVVSDLHMLTTKFDPASTRTLPEGIRQLVAQVIGMGADPERTRFYLQSSMPWQARIYVILQSLARCRRLEEHGSFHEMARAATGGEPTLGLLGYPVLESSDVLAIGATHVTIGQNNLSHFSQLAELLAELESGWGIRLEVPSLITGTGNMVGLDGREKMSKSLGNAVYFVDPTDVIVAKLRAVAPQALDGSVVAAGYLAALGEPAEVVAEVDQEVRRLGDVPAHVLDRLVERVLNVVEPVRARSDEVLAEEGFIDALLRQGGEAANVRGEAEYRSLVSGLGMVSYS